MHVRYYLAQILFAVPRPNFPQHSNRSAGQASSAWPCLFQGSPRGSAASPVRTIAEVSRIGERTAAAYIHRIDFLRCNWPQSRPRTICKPLIDMALRCTCSRHQLALGVLASSGRGRNGKTRFDVAWPPRRLFSLALLSSYHEPRPRLPPCCEVYRSLVLDRTHPVVRCQRAATMTAAAGGYSSRTQRMCIDPYTCRKGASSGGCCRCGYDRLGPHKMSSFSLLAYIGTLLVGVPSRSWHLLRAQAYHSGGIDFLPE